VEDGGSVCEFDKGTKSENGFSNQARPSFYEGLYGEGEQSVVHSAVILTYYYGTDKVVIQNPSSGHISDANAAMIVADSSQDHQQLLE
jgi:hypothetical protein